MGPPVAAIGQDRHDRANAADAIHLATACSLSVSELHTYNLGDFKRWQPIIGIPVREPYPPQEQGQLPV